MAPRSLEHKLQITMFRTGISLAFLSRGILGWFTSRLDCITSFCVVYSFTGILFTVSHYIVFVDFILVPLSSHTTARRTYGDNCLMNCTQDEYKILHPLTVHSLIGISNPNSKLNSQLIHIIYTGFCGDNDKKSTIIYQRH